MFNFFIDDSFIKFNFDDYISMFIFFSKKVKKSEKIKNAVFHNTAFTKK